MMEPPKYSTNAVSPEYGQPPYPTVAAPQHTVVIVPPPNQKDYLVCSILTMIFCCLPLGVAALIFSIQTRDANARCDSVSASSHSRLSFILNMVGLGLGICIYIAVIIYYIVVAVTFAKYYSSYNYSG